MLDADKKEFAVMMKIVCSNYSHANLEKDTLRYWFSKLENYDLKTVSIAFDKWIDNSKFMPTYKDILDLCKPVTPIYNAIAKKVDKAANKQYADNVVKFVQQHNNGASRDWVKYWEYILREPKGHKEITIRAAKDALKNLGKEWQVIKGDSQVTSNNLTINSHN